MPRVVLVFHPAVEVCRVDARGKAVRGFRQRRCRNPPSLADRLSAVASLPEDDTQDRSGRAHDMLREPDRLVDRVHEWMFQDRDLLISTWEQIVLPTPEAALLKQELTPPAP